MLPTWKRMYPLYLTLVGRRALAAHAE